MAMPTRTTSVSAAPTDLFPLPRLVRLRPTELECDAAAGHDGHRRGQPAGEHQLPGPQALPSGSWLTSHTTDGAGWPITAAPVAVIGIVP
jgi:hypothetical protein